MSSSEAEPRSMRSVPSRPPAKPWTARARFTLSSVTAPARRRIVPSRGIRARLSLGGGGKPPLVAGSVLLPVAKPFASLQAHRAAIAAFPVDEPMREFSLEVEDVGEFSAPHGHSVGAGRAVRPRDLEP